MNLISLTKLCSGILKKHIKQMFDMKFWKIIPGSRSGSSGKNVQTISKWFFPERSERQNYYRADLVITEIYSKDIRLRLDHII